MPASASKTTLLLQLRVLGFGFFQDGDVGVGVFPEGEEIFVGGECASASEVGIGAGRGAGGERVGAGYAEMRERSGPAEPDDAAVIDDFLKCGGGWVALSGGEVRFPAKVSRVEAGDVR